MKSSALFKWGDGGHWPTLLGLALIVSALTMTGCDAITGDDDGGGGGGGDDGGGGGVDNLTITVDGSQTTFLEASVNNYFGSDPFVVAVRPVIFFTVVEAGSGEVEPVFEEPSFETAEVVIVLFGGFAGTYVIPTEAFIIFADETSIYTTFSEFSSGSVTVNSFGDVGGKITGEFSGTLFEFFGETSVTVSGTFDATREQDDWNRDCIDPPTTGTMHYIETRPNNDSATIAADTDIQLFDASGNFICGNDDGNTSNDDFSQLAVQLTTGNQYFVKVEGFGDGYYSIWVNTFGFDPTSTGNNATADFGEPNDTNTDATSLSLGTPVDTDLTFFDEDWYQFTAQ